MNKTFLSKYKPSTLNDFIMDPTLLSIFRNLIQLDNLNVLLIGDSGTGKSTLTKILIKEYFNFHVSNDNILYINSLKEQGIQYYRTDFKYFCQTTCTIPNKKKMVIIDDIDVFNEQIQQIFINFIDKYKNIHFILTGNNTQKIVEGLQSRLITFRLQTLTQSHLHSILNKIILQENIEMTPEAIEFLLHLSNHSVRIMVNYLEKFKLLNEPIDLIKIENVCTTIQFSKLELFNSLVQDKNTQEAFQLIQYFYENGYSYIDILDNYFLFIKCCSLPDQLKYKIIKIICKYICIFNQLHEHSIELLFFTNELIMLF